MHALSTMTRALASAPQPQTGLHGLANALSERIGYRLFTVLVLAVVRNVGLLPDLVAQSLRTLGIWLTVLAMAGLGLGVRLAVVRTVGPRVALAVIASLATMISLTLALIGLLGIDA